ncbi:MAG: hypothetical protein LBE76_09590 [Nitrososphaerota archaeon]|nr:hypothetical protein [Nitrososphaerota archaeon]
MYTVSSIELAELSELVENTYCYMRLTYAEEVKLFCDEHNVDFNELRNAVNATCNVDMAEARNGMDDECLQNDIHFLEFIPSNILLPSTITSIPAFKAKLPSRMLSPNSAVFWYTFF